MDPASIFSIIAGSADMYKNANLTIVSLSTGLETIQWAWQRIQAILETWTDDQVRAGQDLDTDTFHQLGRSLKGGRIVIAALEKDLMPLAGESAQEHGATTGRKILNRVQVIWNATALREHQERIRDQMNSMNLMISVLKLPDANTRQQTLNANVSVLRKSDESAYTIVPSALTPSIWSHTDDSVISEASESSLVYRELAFDDDLFTARVYKRNYRGREVRKVKQEIEDDDSPNKTPTTLAVSTTASNAPRTGVSHSSSATDVFELPGLSIPPVVTAGQWVVTGWMVRYESGRHPSHMCPYVGILGPVVTRVLFEYHCLSEWKKIDTAYPKLDCEDVIQNINWRRLFETSVDIPPQWLYHCFIAACLMGKEELIRLILQKDPDIFLTPLYFYDYRHPVELAFYQGHIHIVKMLLRLKPSAMDSLHHLGRFMIRKALREHDNELLAQVLMQDAFDNEQICDDQKHVVRLAHQNGSQTRCLGSFIELLLSRQM
ncbi:MAG: hypothetical protein Q9199_003941 [Rusavskia elegans]